MTCKIIQGDCLQVLKLMDDNSINCCITSPPYWGLRDYGVDGQLGLESTPEEYVAKMVNVFREVKRLLKEDGTLWLNLGDSYAAARGGYGLNKQTIESEAKVQKCVGECAHRNATAIGLKHKQLIGIPWRVAFGLVDDGWLLRQDIIWHKPNPMPESVTDRCTKAHEYIFLLAKNQKYYFDNEAIQEKAIESNDARPRMGQGVNTIYKQKRRESVPRGEFQGKTKDVLGREAFRSIKNMRNKRSVWTVPTFAFPEAHFATFSPKLIEPCVLDGCPEGGIILDPFNGAGTTGLVATRFGRNYIGIELNPEYCKMSRKRIMNDQPLFNMEVMA